jgi:hypothetical protein
MSVLAFGIFGAPASIATGSDWEGFLENSIRARRASGSHGSNQ